MFLNKVYQHVPHSWSNMEYNGDYTMVKINEYDQEYRTVENNLRYPFNLGISKIVRVENPYLYGYYLLKKAEYATKGGYIERQLYHDTAQHKIPSILNTNLDWRLASRVKYGRGVSFSPCPCYANQQASLSNGTNRAMIITKVLVGSSHEVNCSMTLPLSGYDTTVGNNKQVYVKFYDNEFYPEYVVYYTSKLPVVRRRRF